jgi:hypothetical protein
MAKKVFCILKERESQGTHAVEIMHMMTATSIENCYSHSATVNAVVGHSPVLSHYSQQGKFGKRIDNPY